MRSFSPNTVRLSASHSLLIPCVLPNQGYQGGCDHDAARTLLGAGAGCARPSRSVGGAQQGYRPGDYGASPVGNRARPTTGLSAVASGDALGRAGDGLAYPFADPSGLQTRPSDAARGKVPLAQQP